MAVNISGLMLPVLLVVACMALVTNIYHPRKVNKTLVSDIETVQANLHVAGSNSQECNKKLEGKKCRTEEKAKIQKQVTDLTTQLEQANATSLTLQTEIDKLSAGLGTATVTTPEEEGVEADIGDKKEGGK